MTLALALRGEDFAVLAADKQETKTYKSGNYVEIVTKLIKINDSCAFALAGPPSGEIMFRSVANQLLKDRPISANTLWSLGEHLTNRFKRMYRTKSERESNYMQFLLVGIDDEKELSVNFLESPSFLLIPERRFGYIGSRGQSTYFLNHIYNKIKPVTPKLEQLLLLACFCINETAKQDSYVGSEMDIWILRKDAAIEKLSQDRIKEYRDRAEQISAVIAERFLSTN